MNFDCLCDKNFEQTIREKLLGCFNSVLDFCVGTDCKPLINGIYP